MQPKLKKEPITNLEYHEYLISRNMTLEEFNDRYPDLSQKCLQFKLVDFATQKEFFITKVTKAMNNSADISNGFMSGYFSMKHGKPNEKRWKQVEVLMQKNKVELLELRHFPAYFFSAGIYSRATCNAKLGDLFGYGLKSKSDKEIEILIDAYNSCNHFEVVTNKKKKCM